MSEPLLSPEIRVAVQNILRASLAETYAMTVLVPQLVTGEQIATDEDVEAMQRDITSVLDMIAEQSDEDLLCQLEYISDCTSDACSRLRYREPQA